MKIDPEMRTDEFLTRLAGVLVDNNTDHCMIGVTLMNDQQVVLYVSTQPPEGDEIPGPREYH